MRALTIRNSNLSLSFLMMLILSTGFFACDEITDQIEDITKGELTPLSEAELPNCSRVINCCATIEARGLSDTISEACNNQFKPATQLVIDQYKMAKMGITENTQDDTQADALSTLKDETQTTFEPGCRCFLEESIGQLNTDALDLVPLDCEVDSSVGTLPNNLMCSDATSALLEVAAP